MSILADLVLSDDTMSKLADFVHSDDTLSKVCQDWRTLCTVMTHFQKYVKTGGAIVTDITKCRVTTGGLGCLAQCKGHNTVWT